MPTPSHKTKQRIERMLGLHAKGASTREIGEELGVTHKTILAWLADAGLEPNGGHGPRTDRVRRKPEAVAAAIAGAARELEAVTGGAPPSDRGEAITHLQSRLQQMSELADQLAEGVPSGATNPQALATVVRLEREIAAAIAELTPPDAPDPEKDPANQEAAASLRNELERLVSRAEKNVVCLHCGRAPFVKKAG